MEQELHVVLSSPLFAGFSEEEAKAMLGCLSGERARYERGEFLLHAGEQTYRFGLVLSGSVHILREDFWGNRNILSEIGAGGLFAETYADTGAALEVSVMAADAADILLLDARRVFATCMSVCPYHTRLLRNFRGVLAQKNLMLTRKLAHLSQRSTREKLLSYLSAEALRQGAAAFAIPFDRQQLADYLSVDRSAMSSELSKMQREGLLTYSRNRFTLLTRP